MSSMHLTPASTSSIPSLPTARTIHVDTRGAVILNEESPEVRALDLLALRQAHFKQTRDSRGIYLPNHIEPVSHIAVDVRLASFVSTLIK